MSNIDHFARIYPHPAKKCLARVLSAFFYPQIYWKGGSNTLNPLVSPTNIFFQLNLPQEFCILMKASLFIIQIQ
jgi:hypothetical protein